MNDAAQIIGEDSARSVDALNATAFDCRHEDARRARALCLQACAMARRVDYQRGLAYGLLRLGLVEYMLGEDAGLYQPRITQSLTMMRSLGDTSGEAEVLNLQGNIHATRGEHALAIALHEQALQLRRQCGDRGGEAGSLNNLGLSLRELGRHAEALEQLLQSLEIAQALGQPRSKAYALVSIGSSLAALGDGAQACLRFREALELAQTTADRGLECTALTRLAQTLIQDGATVEAQARLQQALALAEQTGNAGDHAEAMLVLAQAHQALGEFDAAHAALHSALATARRRHDSGTEAEALQWLGRNELLQGAADAAVATLETALALSRELGAVMVSAATHELLALAHETRGDFAAALWHFRQFHALRECEQGQATLRRVSGLLSRHEVSGLQREAASQRHLNAELTSALQAEREKAELLAELAAQAEVLRQLSREDGLTGVANRRWFDAQLAREIERARRYGRTLAVAMIDVDDFKSINDRFGHGVGDAVLRRVAALLRDACRSSDLVARYGGEEFVLLLVEAALPSAMQRCDELRRDIQAFDWPGLQAGLEQVSVSIGVACHDASTSSEGILAAADSALYGAKREGKNRVKASAAPAD